MTILRPLEYVPASQTPAVSKAQRITTAGDSPPPDAPKSRKAMVDVRALAEYSQITLLCADAAGPETHDQHARAVVVVVGS